MVISQNNRIRIPSRRDGNVCPKTSVVHHFEKETIAIASPRKNYPSCKSVKISKRNFQGYFFCSDPIHKKQAIKDLLTVFYQKS